MKYLIIFFFSAWVSTGTFAQSKPDAVIGQYWINNKEGKNA